MNYDPPSGIDMMREELTTTHNGPKKLGELVTKEEDQSHCLEFCGQIQL
jgi:hypothetical protein